MAIDVIEEAAQGSIKPTARSASLAPGNARGAGDADLAQSLTMRAVARGVFWATIALMIVLGYASIGLIAAGVI
jgi:hypothetical protein